MGREVYVMHNGRIVPKSQVCQERVQAHYIQADGMDELRHPSTGEYIDSKSRFRQVTKAAGCVEIGDDQGWNDRPPEREASIRGDVEQAISMLNQGYRPNVLPEEF